MRDRYVGTDRFRWQQARPGCVRYNQAENMLVRDSLRPTCPGGSTLDPLICDVGHGSRQMWAFKRLSGKPGVIGIRVMPGTRPTDAQGGA